MSRKIFISLPVSDLPRARAFYEALGFGNEPAMSNEDGACMVLSEGIHVMLVTLARWRGFTTRPIPDPGSSEVALSFDCPSRDEVDRLIAVGAAAGGQADINPPEDHGFMYQRSLADPDGHIWEPFWMEMPEAADPQAQ